MQDPHGISVIIGVLDNESIIYWCDLSIDEDMLDYQSEWYIKNKDDHAQNA